MASALRFGLTRPAAATSQFLQTHSIQSTVPIVAAAATTTLSTHARLFSTTNPLLVGGYPRQGVPRDLDGDVTLPIPKPNSRSPEIPRYPYGERPYYKQSNTGLYGEARIQFGNHVSKKWEVKTPRKWHPNVQRRRLWSESLQCFVQTRVTTRVLRTIDKCGGLDNYLLGGKAQRIKDLGPWGWKLRWRIIQTDVVQERFQLERESLGLVKKSDKEIKEALLKEMESVAPGEAQLLLPVDEVDGMLSRGEEFTIGHDEGFMKEEKP